MGLHICYDLSLPGSTTDDSALALLERLRAYPMAPLPRPEVLDDELTWNPEGARVPLVIDLAS